MFRLKVKQSFYSVLAPTAYSAMLKKSGISVPALLVPERLLLGPGPSNSHPLVLQALSCQPVGHLDPFYIDLMAEVQELLREVWQTSNRLTLPMSGTGSAASGYTGGNGGAGAQNNYRTGSNQYYAAGGGGAGYQYQGSSGTGGTGGTGAAQVPGQGAELRLIN